jgi:hypothetical protein
MPLVYAEIYSVNPGAGLSFSFSFLHWITLRLIKKINSNLNRERWLGFIDQYFSLKIEKNE